MKRQIIANFILKLDTIKIVVLEKVKSTIVEVFSSESKLEAHLTFIKESLHQVKELIGAKITNVSIILDPYQAVKERIQVVRETIKIPSQIVQHQDVRNLVDLVNDKYDTELQKVILCQPILFETHDVITKTFNRAPINKKAHSLSITLAVTTINSKIYNSIHQMMNRHSLKINQILLTPQALSFNNVSEHAQNSGSVLINFDNNQTSLTIIRNYAVVSLLKLNGAGYWNLLNKVSQKFSCNFNEAHKMLMVYANLDQAIKPRVINLNQNGNNEKNLNTNLELNLLVKQFLTNVLTASSTYLQQKLTSKFDSFPIVINGQISKIQGIEAYGKKYLKTELVSTYSPLTFVEQNISNTYGLGVIKFMEKSDQVASIYYDTIIETNPETIPNLNFLTSKSLTQKSKNLLNRILNRFNGKYA